MIISGGVNIYPAEIDQEILKHPAVRDVAVVGVPSKDWGEEVKAVVQLNDAYRPSDALRISFIGKPAGTSLNQGVVRILFGPSETEQEVEFYPATAADKQPALILRGNVRVVARSPQEMAAYEAALKAGEFQFHWSEVTPEQEEAITFISVRRSIREPFILETGPLGGPLAALLALNQRAASWSGCRRG